MSLWQYLYTRWIVWRIRQKMWRIRQAQYRLDLYRKRRRQHLLLFLLVWLVAAWAVAQERDVHFLDCPEVTFFGPRCPEEVALPEPEPELVPAPLPWTPPPVLIPLFPRESLAPSTPPLFLQLLNEPTEANARLFLAWSQERQERGQFVQELLKQLLTPTEKEER
jgi:hypothetical protein